MIKSGSKRVNPPFFIMGYFGEFLTSEWPFLYKNITYFLQFFVCLRAHYSAIEYRERVITLSKIDCNFREKLLEFC